MFLNYYFTFNTDMHRTLEWFKNNVLHMKDMMIPAKLKELVQDIIQQNTDMLEVKTTVYHLF